MLNFPSNAGRPQVSVPALDVLSADAGIPTAIPVSDAVPTRLTGLEHALEHYNNLLREIRLGNLSLSDPAAVAQVAARVSKQVHQMPMILSELSTLPDFSVFPQGLTDIYRLAEETRREAGIVYAQEVLESLARRGVTDVPDKTAAEIYQMITGRPLDSSMLSEYKALLNQNLKQIAAQKRDIPIGVERARLAKPVVRFYAGLSRLSTGGTLADAEQAAIQDTLQGVRALKRWVQGRDLVFTRDLNRAIQEAGRGTEVLKNIFGFGTGEPLAGAIYGHRLLRYLNSLESALQKALSNTEERTVAAARALAITPGPIGNDIQGSIPTNTLSRSARRTAIGYLRLLPFLQTALENLDRAPATIKQFLVREPNGRYRLPTLPEYANTLNQVRNSFAQYVKQLVPLLKREVSVIRKAAQQAPNNTLWQKFTTQAATGGELERTLDIIDDALNQLEQDPSNEQAFITLYRYMEPFLQAVENRVGAERRWLQWLTPYVGATIQALANLLDVGLQRIGTGIGNISGRGRTAPAMFLLGQMLPEADAKRIHQAFGQAVFYKTLLDQAAPVYPNPIDRAIAELGMDPRIPRNAARIYFALTVPGAAWDIASSLSGHRPDEPSVVLTALGAASDTLVLSPSNALGIALYPWLHRAGLAAHSPLGQYQATDIYPVQRLTMAAHPSVANFLAWSAANPTQSLVTLVSAAAAIPTGGTTLGAVVGTKLAQAGQLALSAARGARGLLLSSRLAGAGTIPAIGGTGTVRLATALESAQIASRAAQLQNPYRIARETARNTSLWVFSMLNRAGDLGDVTEYLENIDANTPLERLFVAITDPNMYLLMFGQGGVLTPFTRGYQSLRSAYRVLRPHLRNTSDYLIGYTGNYLDDVERYYLPPRAKRDSRDYVAVSQLPAERETGYVGIRRPSGIVWLPIMNMETQQDPASREHIVTFKVRDENGNVLQVDPTDMNLLVVPKSPVANAGAHSQFLVMRALSTGNASAPADYWDAMLGDVNMQAALRMQVLTPTENGEYQLNPQLYQQLRENLYSAQITALDEQLAMALAVRDTLRTSMHSEQLEQTILENYHHYLASLQKADMKQRILQRAMWLSEFLEDLDSSIAGAMVYDAVLGMIENGQPTLGQFTVLDNTHPDGWAPVTGTVYAISVDRLNQLGVGGTALVDLLAQSPYLNLYRDETTGRFFVGTDSTTAADLVVNREQLRELRESLSRINTFGYGQPDGEWSLVLNAPISGIYDIAQMVGVPLAVSPQLVEAVATPSSEASAPSERPMSPDEAQALEERVRQALAQVRQQPVAGVSDATAPTTTEDIGDAFDFTPVASEQAATQEEAASTEEEAAPPVRARSERPSRVRVTERKRTQQVISRAQVMRALSDIATLFVPSGDIAQAFTREMRDMYRTMRAVSEVDRAARLVLDDIRDALRHVAENPDDITELAMRMVEHQIDKTLTRLGMPANKREETRGALVALFRDELSLLKQRVVTAPMFITGATERVKEIWDEILYRRNRLGLNLPSGDYKAYAKIIELARLTLSDQPLTIDAVREAVKRGEAIGSYKEFLTYWNSPEIRDLREVLRRFVAARESELRNRAIERGMFISVDDGLASVFEADEPTTYALDVLDLLFSLLGRDVEYIAATLTPDVDEELRDLVFEHLSGYLSTSGMHNWTEEARARADATAWVVATHFSRKWIAESLFYSEPREGFVHLEPRSAYDAKRQYANALARALYGETLSKGDEVLGPVFMRMLSRGYNNELDFKHIKPEAREWVQREIDKLVSRNYAGFTLTPQTGDDPMIYIDSWLAGKFPAVAAHALLEELWHGLVFRLQRMEIPRNLVGVLEPIVYDMGALLTGSTADQIWRYRLLRYAYRAVQENMLLVPEAERESIARAVEYMRAQREETAVKQALTDLVQQILLDGLHSGLTKAEQVFIVDSFRYWLQSFGIDIAEAAEHERLGDWFRAYIASYVHRSAVQETLDRMDEEYPLWLRDTEAEDVPVVPDVFPHRAAANPEEALEQQVAQSRVLEDAPVQVLERLSGFFDPEGTGRFQAFRRFTNSADITIQDRLDQLERYVRVAEAGGMRVAGVEPPMGRWQSIVPRNSYALVEVGDVQSRLPINHRVYGWLARIAPNTLRSPEELSRTFKELLGTTEDPFEHGMWELWVGDTQVILTNKLPTDSGITAEAKYVIEVDPAAVKTISAAETQDQQAQDQQAQDQQPTGREYKHGIERQVSLDGLIIRVNASADYKSVLESGIARRHSRLIQPLKVYQTNISEQQLNALLQYQFTAGNIQSYQQGAEEYARVILPSEIVQRNGFRLRLSSSNVGTEEQRTRRENKIGEFVGSLGSYYPRILQDWGLSDLTLEQRIRQFTTGQLEFASYLITAELAPEYGQRTAVLGQLIVITHPDTGRFRVYFVSGYTFEVRSLTDLQEITAASQELAHIASLFQLAEIPESSGLRAAAYRAPLQTVEFRVVSPEGAIGLHLGASHYYPVRSTGIYFAQQADVAVINTLESIATALGIDITDPSLAYELIWEQTALAPQNLSPTVNVGMVYDPAELADMQPLGLGVYRRGNQYFVYRREAEHKLRALQRLFSLAASNSITIYNRFIPDLVSNRSVLEYTDAQGTTHRSDVLSFLRDIARGNLAGSLAQLDVVPLSGLDYLAELYMRLDASWDYDVFVSTLSRTVNQSIFGATYQLASDEHAESIAQQLDPIIQQHNRALWNRELAHLSPKERGRLYQFVLLEPEFIHRYMGSLTDLQFLGTRSAQLMQKVASVGSEKLYELLERDYLFGRAEIVSNGEPAPMPNSYVFLTARSMRMAATENPTILEYESMHRADRTFVLDLVYRAEDDQWYHIPVDLNEEQLVELFKTGTLELSGHLMDRPDTTLRIRAFASLPDMMEFALERMRAYAVSVDENQAVQPITNVPSRLVELHMSAGRLSVHTNPTQYELNQLASSIREFISQYRSPSRRHRLNAHTKRLYVELLKSISTILHAHGVYAVPYIHRYLAQEGYTENVPGYRLIHRLLAQFVGTLRKQTHARVQDIGHGIFYDVIQYLSQAQSAEDFERFLRLLESVDDVDNPFHPLRRVPPGFAFTYAMYEPGLGDPTRRFWIRHTYYLTDIFTDRWIRQIWDQMPPELRRWGETELEIERFGQFDDLTSIDPGEQQKAYENLLHTIGILKRIDDFLNTGASITLDGEELKAADIDVLKIIDELEDSEARYDSLNKFQRYKAFKKALEWFVSYGPRDDDLNTFSRSFWAAVISTRRVPESYRTRVREVVPIAFFYDESEFPQKNRYYFERMAELRRKGVKPETIQEAMQLRKEMIDRLYKSLEEANKQIDEFEKKHNIELLWETSWSDIGSATPQQQAKALRAKQLLDDYYRLRARAREIEAFLKQHVLPLVPILPYELPKYTYQVDHERFARVYQALLSRTGASRGPSFRQSISQVLSDVANVETWFRPGNVIAEAINEFSSERGQEHIAQYARTMHIAVPAVHRALARVYQKRGQGVSIENFITHLLEGLRDLINQNPRVYSEYEDGFERAFYELRGGTPWVPSLGAAGSSKYPIFNAIVNAIVAGAGKSYRTISSNTRRARRWKQVAEEFTKELEAEWNKLLKDGLSIAIQIPNPTFEEATYAFAQVALGILFSAKRLDNTHYVYATRDDYLSAVRNPATRTAEALMQPLTTITIAGLFPHIVFDQVRFWEKANREWIEDVVAAYMLPELQSAVVGRMPTPNSAWVLQRVKRAIQSIASTPDDLSGRVRGLHDLADAFEQILPGGDISLLPAANIDAITKRLFALHGQNDRTREAVYDLSLTKAERIRALKAYLESVMAFIESLTQARLRVGKITTKTYKRLKRQLDALTISDTTDVRQNLEQLESLRSYANELWLAVSPGGTQILLQQRDLDKQIIELFEAFNSNFLNAFATSYVQMLGRRSPRTVLVQLIEPRDAQEAAETKRIRAEMGMNRAVALSVALYAQGNPHALVEADRKAVDEAQRMLAHMLAAIARNEDGVDEKLQQLSKMSAANRDIGDVVHWVRELLTSTGYPVNEGNPTHRLSIEMLAALLRVLTLQNGAPMYGDVLDKTRDHNIFRILGISVEELEKADSLEKAKSIIEDAFQKAIQQQRERYKLMSTALTHQLIRHFRSATPDDWRAIDSLLSDHPDQELEILTAFAGAAELMGSTYGAINNLVDNVAVAVEQIRNSRTYRNATILGLPVLALLVNISDLVNVQNTEPELPYIGIYTLARRVRPYRAISRRYYPRIVGELGRVSEELKPLLKKAEIVGEILADAILNEQPIELIRHRVHETLVSLRLNELREQMPEFRRRLAKLRQSQQNKADAALALLEQLSPAEAYAYEQAVRAAEEQFRHLIYLWEAQADRQDRDEMLKETAELVALSILYDAAFLDAKRAADIYVAGLPIFGTQRNREAQEIYLAIAPRTTYFISGLSSLFGLQLESAQVVDQYSSLNRDFIVARNRLLGVLSNMVDMAARAYSGSDNPFIAGGREVSAREAFGQAAFATILAVGELLRQAELTPNLDTLSQTIAQINAITDRLEAMVNHLVTYDRWRQQQSQQTAAMSTRALVGRIPGEEETPEELETPEAPPAAAAPTPSETVSALLPGLRDVRVQQYIRQLLDELFPQLSDDWRNHTSQMIARIGDALRERQQDLTLQLRTPEEELIKQLRTSEDETPQIRVRFRTWISPTLFDDFVSHTHGALEESTYEVNLSEARAITGWVHRLVMLTLPSTRMLNDQDRADIAQHARELLRLSTTPTHLQYTASGAFTLPEIYEELVQRRVSETGYFRNPVTPLGIVGTLKDAIESTLWSSSVRTTRLHDGDDFLINDSVPEVFLMLNLFGVVPVVGSNKRVVDMVYDPDTARENLERFREYIRKRLVAPYYDRTPIGGQPLGKIFDSRFARLLEFHDKITKLIDQIRNLTDADATAMSRGIKQFVQLLFATNQRAYLPQLLFTHEFAQLLMESIVRPDRYEFTTAAHGPVNLAELENILDTIRSVFEIVHGTTRGITLTGQNTELITMAHMLSRVEGRRKTAATETVQGTYLQHGLKVSVGTQLGTRPSQTTVFLEFENARGEQIRISLKQEDVAQTIRNRYRQHIGQFLSRLVRGKFAGESSELVLAIIDDLQEAAYNARVQMLSETTDSISRLRAEISAAMQIINSKDSSEAQKQDARRRVKQLGRQLRRATVLRNRLETDLEEANPQNVIFLELLKQYIRKHGLPARFDDLLNYLRQRGEYEPETVQRRINAIAAGVAQYLFGETRHAAPDNLKQVLDVVPIEEFVTRIPIRAKFTTKGADGRERSSEKTFQGIQNLPLMQRAFGGKIDTYQFVAQVLDFYREGGDLTEFRYIPFLTRPTADLVEDMFGRGVLSLDVPVGETQTLLGETEGVAPVETLGAPGGRVQVTTLPIRKPVQLAKKHKAPSQEEQIAQTILAQLDRLFSSEQFAQAVLQAFTETIQAQEQSVTLPATLLFARTPTNYDFFLSSEAIRTAIENAFTEEKLRRLFDVMEEQAEQRDRAAVRKRYDEKLRRDIKRAQLSGRSEKEIQAIRLSILRDYKKELKAAERVSAKYRELMEDLWENHRDKVLELARNRIFQTVAPEGTLFVRKRLLVQRNNNGTRSIIPQITILNTREAIRSAIEQPVAEQLYGVIARDLHAHYGTPQRDGKYVIHPRKHAEFLQAFRVFLESEVHAPFVYGLYYNSAQLGIDWNDSGKVELIRNSLKKALQPLSMVASQTPAQRRLEAAVNQLINKFADRVVDTARELYRVLEAPSPEGTPPGTWPPRMGGLGSSSPNPPRGSGGGGVRRPNPPRGGGTRQYRKEPRMNLFGEVGGGRFQSFPQVFKQRSGIIMTHDASVRTYRAALELLRSLVDSPYNEAVLDDTTLLRMMYGDTQALDTYIGFIQSHLIQDHLTRERKLQDLQARAFYTLLRHMGQHMQPLSEMLYRIMTTAQALNDVPGAITAAVETTFGKNQLKEYQDAINRLLPFYDAVLAQTIKDRILDALRPQLASTAAGASTQQIQNLIDQTLFYILNILNVAHLLTHYSILVDHRTNLPHETTFNTHQNVVLYPNRSYDGKTEATFITYTPILTEYQVLPPETAQMSLAERYGAEHTVSLEQLMVRVPIGSDDSQEAVLIPVLSETALTMTELYLDLRRRNASGDEMLTKHRAYDAANGLIQHQRELIGYARDPNATQLPVWLFVHTETTALAGRFYGKEKNRLRIRKTTVNVPISFMPYLREWLNLSGLDEFFITLVPINPVRSTPVRLSKLIAGIGRLLKTTVDLTGGGLISAGQNWLYNMFNRDALRAIATGFLFGWAPYASAGFIYEWYQRMGRTRRSIDAHATYHLLRLQFDAMRTYNPSTQQQNAELFRMTGVREAEHLPIVFSTNSKELYKLYQSLRAGIERLLGNVDPETIDNATEMLIIRAHLDDNIWHETPELFYENLLGLVTGDNPRLTTRDALIEYLGTDEFENAYDADGNPIYAAALYLEAIENNEIPISRVQFRYWNNGISMLFKLHNRFYTRLLRTHGFRIREPQAALLLMEHLLMNAVFANYLQRIGIGTGIMRPEGLFAGIGIIHLDERAGAEATEDESGNIYRGLGRQLWWVRKLYDAFVKMFVGLTGLNAIYNNLPASWRSLNAAVSLALAGLFFAGVLHPLTFPLLFVSGFFTLSNFLSKITWVSMTAYELQRDLRAYEVAAPPAAQISMLANATDTNQLLRLFNKQMEAVRNANAAALTGINGFIQAVQFPPEAVVQAPGSTRLILETQNSDTEILLSEPHAIALLAMVQRPDMLPAYIEQLKEVVDTLPSVSELETYVRHYITAFQQLGTSYEIVSKTLQYGNRTVEVYFLRVEQRVNNQRQVRYYELSWFKENIRALIQRLEEIQTRYDALHSAAYHHELEAAETVMAILLERQRRLMDLPAGLLTSPAFEILAQELNPMLDELLGDTRPTTYDYGFSEEVNAIRSTLERIMLYSARVEAALDTLAFRDIETDIRTEKMLEMLTDYDEYRETLDDARELALEYEQQVLHPVKRYALETFLIPVATRHTLGQVVRGTISHFVLAPNVLLSQFSFLAGTVQDIARRLGFRRGTERELGEWEEQLFKHGAGALVYAHLQRAGLILALSLLAVSAYCISPQIQQLYQATGMNNIFEFECRSGRFGAISIGYRDEKLTFRPAYVIDLATRYVYHLLRLTGGQRGADPETRTNTLVDIAAGLTRETIDWISVRIPPLEVSALEFASRALRELGLAAFPGAFEFSAYESIRQQEEATLTGYRFFDDMLSMLSSNFMPMGLENLQEMLAAYALGNMRSTFWHWFYNDEAIKHWLVREPKMGDSPRIWGYPLGLPDWERTVRALPYIAQSASVRAVRPYNPLNQVRSDVPHTHALGFYTPKGAIESRVAFNGTTLAEATRSYSSRVDRNADYNRILRGLDPLIYSTFELQPAVPGATLREVLEERNIAYSPLIQVPNEVRALVEPNRAAYFTRPSRIVRRAMMLYEYLYLKEPGKLKHLRQYRERGPDPSTLNGIVRNGARYALLQSQRPLAVLYHPKAMSDNVYRGIWLYHIYAGAELYRIMGMGIDPKLTEQKLRQLSTNIYDPSRRVQMDTHVAYAQFVNFMHGFVENYIRKLAAEDGITLDETARRYYYELLLYRGLLSEQYRSTYSPSYYAGELFALGLFFAKQNDAIVETIQKYERELRQLGSIFGERSTRSPWQR